MYKRVRVEDNHWRKQSMYNVSFSTHLVAVIATVRPFLGV